MKVKTFDIVIAHYGVGHLTELCLKCLETIRASSYDYRVILVDNASPEFEKLLPALESLPHEIIRNSENLGFVKATNQGIAISNAPYVVLLNNDTEVVEGWLDELKRPFANHLVGLSGPLSSAEGSWQGNRIGWPVRPGHVQILAPRRMLAFFCTMFRREVFRRVGLLDESYGAGLGDDDNYCWRAENKGYSLALCQGLVIKHHHRSTFRTLYTDEEISSMQVAAMAKFRSEAGVK